MPIAPEGRFIPVNMDRCQDIMGRGAVRARYTGPQTIDNFATKYFSGFTRFEM